MKKITAVILAIILTFGCLGITAIAKENEAVKFAVASDIHAKDKGEKIANEHPESKLYFHAQNSGNLYCEAIGILVDFLNGAKKEGAQFILLPGDVTNSGTQSQHEYMASVLAEFENESGIPVYIVPGNHDLARSTPAEFKAYYKQFGYDEAITVDDETASYVVDLPGNYRLIAVDSNNPGSDGDGLNERTLNWIKEQAEKAKADGKVIFEMEHHAILDPIPFAETIMKDFIVRGHKDIAEKFTQWGIQYVFTGHEHGNNITSFKGTNGNMLYDILTTALTSYPLEYRFITVDKDGMNIQTRQITECNWDYVVYDGYTAEQLELMRTDYTKYAYEYFRYAIEKKIYSKTNADFICKKLKVTDGAVYDALQTVVPLIDESLAMPLYSKDTDGMSVQKLAKSAGATLPASDYYNLYDLASTVVAKIYYGSENIPFSSSPEGKVLVVGLNTMLKYILAEAGNRTATLALNAVFSQFNIGELKELGLFRWNRSLVIGADHSYEVAYSVLAPILDKFLLDDSLDDRNITLPAPGENVQENKLETFFTKLIDFFKYILNIVKTAMFLKKW